MALEVSPSSKSASDRVPRSSKAWTKQSSGTQLAPKNCILKGTWSASHLRWRKVGPWLSAAWLGEDRGAGRKERDMWEGDRVNLELEPCCQPRLREEGGISGMLLF